MAQAAHNAAGDGAHGDGVYGDGTYGAAHTPQGAGADGAHGAGAHDPHHDVSGDKGAAFVGLVGGLVLIGGLLFGMVKWTNHHLGAESGGTAAAAAEATK